MAAVALDAAAVALDVALGSDVVSLDLTAVAFGVYTAGRGAAADPPALFLDF